MDEVEKKGLLVIPETARDANTPKESTGLIVAVGDGVEQNWVVRAKRQGADDYSSWNHKSEQSATKRVLAIQNSYDIDSIVVEPPMLVEGVAIMFGKHSGFEIMVDKEEFRIIDIEDILCTIEFEDPSVVVPIKEG